MENDESSQIVFEDNGLQKIAQTIEEKPPKITEWVIKHSGGSIKDTGQANNVLFGLVIVLVIISLVVIFSSSKAKISSPSADLINQPQPAEGYIPR